MVVTSWEEGSIFILSCISRFSTVHFFFQVEECNEKVKPLRKKKLLSLWKDDKICIVTSGSFSFFISYFPHLDTSRTYFRIIWQSREHSFCHSRSISSLIFCSYDHLPLFIPRQGWEHVLLYTCIFHWVSCLWLAMEKCQWWLLSSSAL